MAKDVNFDIIQGDSFILQVDYKDTSNVAINLTGYTATCKVKDSFGGNITCATITEISGITINAVNGTILLNFTPTQTKKFTMPRASFQLQLVAPNTTKTTVLSGWFSVSKGNI
jgi:hypothetical protein